MDREDQWIDSGGKVLHYGHFITSDSTIHKTLCYSKGWWCTLAIPANPNKPKCKNCLRILERILERRTNG